MDDSGGCDDRNAGGVNISFIDQFNHLAGYEFRRCVLRLEALLLKQLREHGPRQLIAFRSRRQAIDAPGRRRDGWRRMLGNHLVRRELGFRCRTGTEVFDDVAYALLDGITLFTVQRLALVVCLGGSNDGMSTES